MVPIALFVLNNFIIRNANQPLKLSLAIMFNKMYTDVVFLLLVCKSNIKMTKRNLFYAHSSMF